MKPPSASPTGGNAWRQVVAALADPDRFHLFARIVLNPSAEADPGRGDRRRLTPLLVAGVVVRDDDPDARETVYLAARVLPQAEPVTDLVLTRRLRDVAVDPVGIRRALVDSGIVTRARDGSAYWRTEEIRVDADGPSPGRG